jgi:pimeloyl-ACP methyl ester carboxylesterase
MQPFPFDRVPVTIIFEEKAAFKETYGGSSSHVLLEGQYLKPHKAMGDGKTVVVFMHPTGVMNWLPLPIALASAGIPVLTCGSRYPHNDTGLIMEKVVLDLGRYIRHAREELGFDRVVLAGWSGGGSLSMLYQAQAERPTITDTPAGDPVDLVGAGLIPADGMMQLAAHVSRAITLSEWIDPSIGNEADPYDRDPALDIYAENPPERAPYSEGFQATYRAAQKARIMRITADVRTRLEDLKRKGRPHEEFAFVVHGTMADLRWLDATLDPNDRVPGQCYMGDPKVVNMSPAHLARFSSLRAWMSQWSELSRADGPACAAGITVPALVVENTADDACTPSHTQRIYDGFKAVTPELHRIEGATHYYIGQREHLAQAAQVVIGWMARNRLLNL